MRGMLVAVMLLGGVVQAQVGKLKPAPQKAVDGYLSRVKIVRDYARKEIARVQEEAKAARTRKDIGRLKKQLALYRKMLARDDVDIPLTVGMSGYWGDVVTVKEVIGPSAAHVVHNNNHLELHGIDTTIAKPGKALKIKRQFWHVEKRAPGDDVVWTMRAYDDSRLKEAIKSGLIALPR